MKKSLKATKCKDMWIVEVTTVSFVANVSDIYKIIKQQGMEVFEPTSDDKYILAE